MITNITEARSIPDAFYLLAGKYPDRVVYHQAIAVPGDTGSEVPRRRRSVNYRSVEANVNKLAAALLAHGVTKGSKVAILSQTRPEWMEADLAILGCGAVAVSVYQSLPAEDIAYILYDSGAEIVFAENQEQVEKLLRVASEEFDMPATEGRPARRVQLTIRKIFSFEQTEPHQLVTSYSEIVDGSEAGQPDGSDSLSPDDLAALVYTSGTTGPPKGVMQSHGNHLANVRQSWESGLVNSESSICLFLPLAHSFAKLMGYLGFLTPVTLHFPSIADSRSSAVNPQSTTKDIRESGAQLFPVVPRLLEKMRDGVLAARTEPGLKGRLIALTIWSAASVYAANRDKRRATVGARLAYAVTGSLRKKIQQKLFGNSLRFALSGGAKLPVEVAEFFIGLGVTVIEGYGLTETCVATNVGRLGKTPVGSVGPVLASDIEMKIAEDGEVLFRGPNVALGYYNRPEATAASWGKDGWFHTGDLGSVDEQGNLRIVGRKKEILVTSGGKNIAPNDIEDKLKSFRLVSQAVLFGDGRKYCVALMTLVPEEVRAWARHKNIPLQEPLHETQAVKDRIWDHVCDVNAGLARHETVKKIALVGEEFSIENGLLTPTFKVKRPLVEERYKEVIDSLYE